MKPLTASRIRWACLAAIYGIFLFWYGGSGDPISPEEAEKYIARLEARATEQNARRRGLDEDDFDVAANWREFMEADDGQEFVMLNLNVYREAPEYGDDVDGSEAIASAAAAEDEYQRRVAPILLSRACHVLVMVEPALFLAGIGNFERQDWNLASMALSQPAGFLGNHPAPGVLARRRSQMGSAQPQHLHGDGPGNFIRDDTAPATADRNRHRAAAGSDRHALEQQALTQSLV